MSEIIVTTGENTVEIRLNRPEKRNAVTPEMLRELIEVVEEYGKKSETHILILRGEGDDFFSAGFDISRIPAESTGKVAGNVILDEAVTALEKYPFPSIAMLNGPVFGGSCELAFACDFRLAADHVKMCIPPAKLGLVYSLNGLQRVASVIGLSNTKKMFLTANIFGIDKLEQMGAVDEVYPLSELPQKVEKLAKTMGGLAPLSLKGNKAILNLLAEKQLLPEQEKFVQDLVHESFLSEDAKEGKQAFFEKRKPAFKGK
jgi:enoyl-CoA hydratase/carnithine racemase